MNSSNQRRPRTQFLVLGIICLLPLSSIWVHLPQAITLASLGVFCLLGSFGIKWRLRTKADTLEELVRSDGKVATSSDRPVIDVIAEGTTSTSVASTPPQLSVTNAFSIDLEDYFHTEVACKVVHHDAWDAMPSCVERSTMELLEILDRTNTRATIFVLGWVARKQPNLVRHIQDRGHEVACHSDRHRRVHTLTPAEFFEDTRVAREAIQDAGGKDIRGYRAPSFSITEGTEWAFDILADLGFTYDSSVYPVYHPTYGNPQAMRFPYYVADCRLLEIPVATWRVCGINLPVGGGAYLRVLPERYIRAGLRAINEIDREPAMLYVHPWEIDPIQPRLKLDTTSQLRQTIGLHTMAAKLERLLTAQPFAPIEQVYAHLIPQWHTELQQPLPFDAVEVRA
jgi:polysaccharide deacetylase family protein (PEP-CTERM system associated)